MANVELGNKSPETFDEFVAFAVDNLNSFLHNSSTLSDKSMDAIYEAARVIKQAQLKEDAKRMRIDDRASYKKDMAEAKKQPKGELRDAAVKMAKDKRNLDKDIFKVINDELAVNEVIRKNAFEAQKLDNRVYRLSQEVEKMSKDDPNYERLKAKEESLRRNANRVGNIGVKFAKENELVNKKTKNELTAKYPFAKKALEDRAEHRESALFKNFSGDREELKGYRQRITEQIRYDFVTRNIPLDKLQPSIDFFSKPLGKRDQFKLGVRDMGAALKAKVQKIKATLEADKETPERETPQQEKTQQTKTPQAKKRLDLSGDIKPKTTTKSPDVAKTTEAPNKDLTK